LLLFRGTLLRGALYLTDGICVEYVCVCVCVVHNECVKLGKSLLRRLYVYVCVCVGREGKKFGINLFNGGGHPESTGK